MDRKEQIIHTTLKLAAKKGLEGISMQDIADSVGIKKPSLYNHFSSKEELIREMYLFLRDKAKAGAVKLSNIDYSELIKNSPPDIVLKTAVKSYVQLNRRDEELLLFYKLLYSERAISPDAAGILINEAERMVIATKNLFYALQVHGYFSFDDIDTAAEGFAFAVHGMMDHQMDRETCDTEFDGSMLDRYVTWFCRSFGGKKNEKNKT